MNYIIVQTMQGDIFTFKSEYGYSTNSEDDKLEIRDEDIYFMVPLDNLDFIIKVYSEQEFNRRLKEITVGKEEGVMFC
jgi:hypothetical protein